MRGLLYNLLAKAARTTECENEAWDLAAAVGALAANDLALLELETDSGLPPLRCGGDQTFARITRSVMPLHDADWGDLPGVPVAFGRGRKSSDK